MSGDANINIEIVRVKDKGNRADGIGHDRIDDNYCIGKDEITVRQ